MPKITFVKEKQEVEVPEGTNLRKAAQQAGIEVYPKLNKYLNCHGLGQCGTCRVLVKSGMENLSPKSVMEKISFTLHPIVSFAVIGHENEMRLSCQVKVKGDCSIVTQPPFNMDGVNFWQKPYPNK